MLLADTVLHQETLARLGLLKPLAEYESGTSFVTDEVMAARKTVNMSNFDKARLMLAAQPRLNP